MGACFPGACGSRHAERLTATSANIFAELPGNFAKLQPPEDQDLMDGLEVKVRLGSVWKQSLTELSGGQRLVFPCPTNIKLTPSQISALDPSDSQYRPVYDNSNDSTDASIAKGLNYHNVH